VIFQEKLFILFNVLCKEVFIATLSSIKYHFSCFFIDGLGGILNIGNFLPKVHFSWLFNFSSGGNLFLYSAVLEEVYKILLNALI
jgi:hypothetical protein